MGWKDFVEDLGFKEGVVVGCAVTIVGALVALLLGMRIDTTATVKWWELMTAFGTVGSVAAATWIAVWSATRGSEKERRIALIVAAELSVGLRPAIHQLKRVMLLFRQAEKTRIADPVRCREHVNRAVEIIKSIDIGVEDHHLVRIASLDADTADRAAKAQGILCSAKKLAVTHRFSSIDAMPVEQKDFYILASHCQNARRWLYRVSRDCGQASKFKYRIATEWKLPEKTTNAPQSEATADAAGVEDCSIEHNSTEPAS